jgi:hypothetical protein
MEIFNNIIFREVTTFSVMVDIYRGMPVIYASYTGYDEIAHHFGAESKEAFRALRGVDKQVRQIDRIRQLYMQRDYDLYILSDHGMTPSVPFRRSYGQTLDEFIAACTDQEVHSGGEAEGSELWTEAGIHFLLDEMKGLEERPHRRLPAQWLRVARQRLEDRLAVEALVAEWDLSRRGDIVVRNSGSLSHVYFNVAPHPMDLSEIALLYPQLLEALAEHEGIGLVVGREGEEVAIAGRAGTLWVGTLDKRIEGQNPLSTLADSEWAVEQLARVARFPHAGDLMLLGSWNDQQVVTFEDQVATHGGLGGPQVWPFVAFSSRERLSARGIDNSEELYTRMARAYGRYEWERLGEHRSSDFRLKEPPYGPVKVDPATSAALRVERERLRAWPQALPYVSRYVEDSVAPSPFTDLDRHEQVRILGLTHQTWWGFASQSSVDDDGALRDRHRPTPVS